MIAALTGRLIRKAADYLVVDVAGVGYQVSVPLSTYYGLPEDGGDVSLHIHTHLREDSLSLFGFLTQAEKDMFLLLLGVSGIGPKIALAILSSLSVEDLAHALDASDDSRLYAIPGIGKKTAARMVLELKDKIKHFAPFPVPPGQAPAVSENVEDAVSALVNLGYKRPLAEEALRKVRGIRRDLPLAELIREALNVLMKR
jgi:Holliday junction DNA helicase RuvA